MRIGSKIKELRVLKGLTQEEACRQGRAVEGLHFTAGTRPDFTINCNLSGYSAVPWHGP